MKTNQVLKVKQHVNSNTINIINILIDKPLKLPLKYHYFSVQLTKSQDYNDIICI